jgi:hypothetical protein
MSQAPRIVPGGRAAAEEAEEASLQIITITVNRPITTAKGQAVAETHTLAIGIVPINEQIECRKATGLPYTAFWSSMDTIAMDSVMVLWWLARRANGEAGLLFAQAVSEWPVDLRGDELDVQVDAADPEATDPEA